MALDLTADFEGFEEYIGLSAGAVEVRNTFLHVGKTEDEINKKIWASDFVCNYREGKQDKGMIDGDFEIDTGVSSTKSRRRRPGKKARTRMARRMSQTSETSEGVDVFPGAQSDPLRVQRQSSEASPTNTSGDGAKEVPLSQAKRSEGDHEQPPQADKVDPLNPAYIRPSALLQEASPMARNSKRDSVKKIRRGVSFEGIPSHPNGITFAELRQERKASGAGLGRFANTGDVQLKDRGQFAMKVEGVAAKDVPQPSTVADDAVPGDVRLAGGGHRYEDPDAAGVARRATPMTASKFMEDVLPCSTSSRSVTAEQGVTESRGASHIPRSVATDPAAPAANAGLSPFVSGALVVLTVVVLLSSLGIVEVKVGKSSPPPRHTENMAYFREEMEMRMASQEQRIKDFMSELYKGGAEGRKLPDMHQAHSDGGFGPGSVGADGGFGAHRPRFEQHEDSGSGSWLSAKSLFFIWLILVCIFLTQVPSGIKIMEQIKAQAEQSDRVAWLRSQLPKQLNVGGWNVRLVSDEGNAVSVHE